MIAAIALLYSLMTAAERMETQVRVCAMFRPHLVAYDVRLKGIKYTYTDGSIKHGLNGSFILKE